MSNSGWFHAYQLCLYKEDCLGNVLQQNCQQYAMPLCHHHILFSQGCAACCYFTTSQKGLLVRLRSLHWLSQVPQPAQQAKVLDFADNHTPSAQAAVHVCVCLITGFVWGQCTIADSMYRHCNAESIVRTACKLLMNRAEAYAELD